MIHKLLSRQPLGAVLSLRTCKWSLDTGRSLGHNQKTCTSGVDITSKQQTSMILHPRNQTLLNISNCKRSISHNIVSKKRRYNRRFQEFHKSIVSREVDFTMSHLEWENIESEILAEDPRSEAGLDHLIMKSLNAMPDLSLSFFNYIKSKREPNVFVLTEFFVNCTEKYEDIVIDEFEKFMKTSDKHEIQVHLQNKIAMIISKTRAWRQCIPLMRTNEHHVSSNALKACSQFFKESLKIRDYKTFFDVWNSVLPLKYRCDMKLISEAFYESWKEGVIPVDVLFELLKLEELPLKEYQITELKEYCSRNWADNAVANVTHVNGQSRICSTCSEKLPELEAIDDSICKKIGKQLLQKVLKGENVYRNSNPREMQKFYEFMSEQKQPFDYVIDGSNVKYMNVVGGPKSLQLMLENLNRDGKRVLVIVKGKKDKQFPLHEKTAAFAIDLKSSDDCYIMLAAFSFGRRCFVVTNDDLRDYLSLLDADVKPYFYAWREQNRVFHCHGNLMHHPNYSWQTHESEKAWHIYYLKTIIPGQYSSISYEEYKLKSFLCVTKLNYVPSPELTLFKKSKNELLKK